MSIENSNLVLKRAKKFANAVKNKNRAGKGRKIKVVFVSAKVFYFIKIKAIAFIVKLYIYPLTDIFYTQHRIGREVGIEVASLLGGYGTCTKAQKAGQHHTF